MRIISGTARGTKLNTLEGEATRPTLDRVKEALFSSIQNNISDANVLDLFSGSGALGLECLSRGAKLAVLCDKSYEAVNIIKSNVQKTKMDDRTIIVQKDYIKCIENLKNKEIKFDIIFLDPPYKTDYALVAIEKIKEANLMNDDGIIVVETDEEKIINELENQKIMNVYNKKKYGRVTVMFLNRKG